MSESIIPTWKKWKVFSYALSTSAASGENSCNSDVGYALYVLKIFFPGFTRLEELKTGTILCKLLLFLAPLVIPPPYESNGSFIEELKRQANIRQFYAAAERIGFSAMEYFPPICFEQFNAQKAATCVVEIIIFGLKNGWIPNVLSFYFVCNTQFVFGSKPFAFPPLLFLYFLSFLD